MNPFSEEDRRIAAESDRVIEQAMAERRAYESGCQCGAVDVEGGTHLEWCPCSEPGDAA